MSRVVQIRLRVGGSSEKVIQSGMGGINGLPFQSYCVFVDPD